MKLIREIYNGLPIGLCLCDVLKAGKGVLEWLHVRGDHVKLFVVYIYTYLCTLLSVDLGLLVFWSVNIYPMRHQ